MPARYKWTNDFPSNTSEEVQRSVDSLTTMVHSLLESNKDVSSRLANLEERLLRTAVPAADNLELQSVFENPSFTTSTSALNTYQQSAIGAQEVSLAASEAALSNDSELDPRVQRILQESRVYSRNLNRHSVTTIPWSYRSIGGCSMLSGITLDQISNISVLSIPIVASEMWRANHYVDISISQPSRSNGTLVNRRLRTQKLSEIIPYRSAGISQGFRRLISPLFLDSDEARRLNEVRRNNEIDFLIRSEKPKLQLLLLGKPIDRRDIA